MKGINYFLLRSVSALIIGLVLLVWPGNAIVYLVITIGVLFMVPGLISIITYFVRNREKYPHSMFPLEGAGSFLFGLWLVIMPSFFVGILMYLLGFFLVLGGVQQLVTLSRARQWVNVPFAFYIVPCLILLLGVVVLFNPFTVAATTFMVLGITSIVYGLNDILNWIKFRRKNSYPRLGGEQDVEDAEIIE